MYYFGPSTLEQHLLPENLTLLQTIYQKNEPFPHIILDDFLMNAPVKEVAKRFPSPHDLKWWKYENILERKLALDDLTQVHGIIRNLVYELMSKPFVTFLEHMTGIHGLIVDHTLNGGGLHQIVRGGKLDIHADYNYHPITKLDRRLNVLLYLNENWEPEWNGNLELWDKGMTQCVRSIEPIMNRLVVFSTTDDSFHGHPDPLMCPEFECRKSIALYYYTNGRPAHERSAPHSTIFKKRPQDPDDKAAEELRLKRAIRRISS